MKRDMNLIRLLLLQLDGDKSERDLSAYSEDQQKYNIAKLIEAGFIRGEVVRDERDQIAAAAATELTWAGHEFLDAARNEATWKKTLDFIASKGLVVTVELLKQLLLNFTKSQLGI